MGRAGLAGAGTSPSLLEGIKCSCSFRGKVSEQHSAGTEATRPLCVPQGKGGCFRELHPWRTSDLHPCPRHKPSAPSPRTQAPDCSDFSPALAEHQEVLSSPAPAPSCPKTAALMWQLPPGGGHRCSCAVSSTQPLCRAIHRLPAGPAALPSTHVSCKRAENSSKTAGTGRLGRNLQPFPLLLGCKRARLKAPRVCELSSYRLAPLDASVGTRGAGSRDSLQGNRQPHARDVLSPSDGAGWELPESSFLCLLRHRGNFPAPCVAPRGLTVTPTARRGGSVSSRPTPLLGKLVRGAPTVPKMRYLQETPPARWVQGRSSENSIHVHARRYSNLTAGWVLVAPGCSPSLEQPHQHLVDNPAGSEGRMWPFLLQALRPLSSKAPRPLGWELSDARVPRAPSGPAGTGRCAAGCCTAARNRKPRGEQQDANLSPAWGFLTKHTLGTILGRIPSRTEGKNASTPLLPASSRGFCSVKTLCEARCPIWEAKGRRKHNQTPLQPSGVGSKPMAKKNSGW